MITFQRWKKDIVTLKRLVDARFATDDIVVLPPVVCEWFDLNRRVPPEEMSDAIAQLEFVQDRLEREINLAKKNGFELFGATMRWIHFETHGIKFLLTHYLRNAERFYLAQVEPLDRLRKTPHTPKEERVIKHCLEALGGDADKNFVMRLGPPEAADLIALWTWKAAA